MPCVHHREPNGGEDFVCYSIERSMERDIDEIRVRLNHSVEQRVEQYRSELEELGYAVVPRRFLNWLIDQWRNDKWRSLG